MRIYLGADHVGFEMRNLIKAHLEKTGYDVADCGTHTHNPADDYPIFCVEVASRTVADPDSLGTVLGDSGNGERIAANKVKGARYVLAWSVETAELTCKHDNAQLIDLGGRMHSGEEALAIVDAFVSQPWSGRERHQHRIDILAEYGKTGVAPGLPEA